MKPYLQQFEERLLNYYTCLNYGKPPGPEEYERALADIKALIIIVNEFERRDAAHEQQVIARLDYLRGLPKPDYDAHQ